MSDWDQDYLDMEVPGHLPFSAERSGGFQFGLVQAQMDCKIDQRQGQRIEFTWHGLDEGDELTGRGHAELVDGELHDHLYIHLGDDSAFRAVQEVAPKPSRQRNPG